MSITFIYSYQRYLSLRPRGTHLCLLINSQHTNPALSFLSTVFVQSLVMQREKGQRTLLTVQGVSGSTYYLAAFCRDIILYLMPLVLDFIIMYSVQLPIFINTSPLPWLLLAILAGPPIILQAYFFSFFFKRSGTVGPVVGFGQALLIFIPYFIVTFATNGQVPSWIAYLLTIVLTPTFGLQFAFKVSQEKATCFHILLYYYTLTNDKSHLQFDSSEP